ncbi:MAG TPA: winged helix-turn-helix domain-containing protein, partial [Chloroflexia bacterium]|nr:winged helix-turn-helix domain-containing protein [Chloroflexia bacterium]
MDLSLRIAPGSGEALHRQVYRQIRGAILDGRLGPGSRLPPTRRLAATLHLARNTVNDAYAELLAEGYLEARPGAGTYVAAHLPDHLLTPAAPASHIPTPPHSASPQGNPAGFRIPHSALR